MKVIKDVRDFPEWFDISNYDYLKPDDLSEINNQLYIRSTLNETLKYSDWPDIMTAYYKDREDFLAEWEHIKRTGKSRDPEEIEIHKDDFSYIFGTQNINTLNIASVRWMSKEVDLLKDDQRNLNIVLSDHQSEYASIDYQWQQVDPNHNQLCVAVDLEANDSILIKEFRQLLKEYRKAAGVEDKKEYITADKIISQRIIPLIDLRIWSHINKTKISNAVMARKLFPNGEKGEYELRTSIQGNAKKVLSVTFLNNLSSKARLSKEKL